jgi:ubiquinone/menaquinone biosynthesis C-methylase UbiE
MDVEPFKISTHNAHYEGEYTDRNLLWRRLGAVDKVNNIASMLNGREARSILEVGCGTGSVLAEMIRKNIGLSHVGVDVANPETHRDRDAQGLDLREYDGNQLPFDDGTFDLVVASHVVEHVTEPRRFIKEIARVAAKYVYIEVPCDIRLGNSRFAVERALSIGHINGYTPEYFMILLQSSGFTPKEFSIFDHSRAVQYFDGRNVKSVLIALARAFALKYQPVLASRLFCYHCAALLEIQQK